MKTVVSAMLWAAGGVHFLWLFFVCAFALLISSPQRIFPLVRFLMRLQLRVMGMRLKVFGLERFDPEKTYLIMGNHESMFDVIAIPAALPGHAVAFEASYHFTLPLWGYLIGKWGNIPAHRRNRARGMGSLKVAARTLRSGTSVVILPEGGRTLDGRIGSFKKGPFHLARSAKADILPFVFDGMYAYNNKHSLLLTPGPVCVVFGTPIPHEAYRDLPPERIAERVRSVMIDLKPFCEFLITT